MTRNRLVSVLIIFVFLLFSMAIMNSLAIEKKIDPYSANYDIRNLDGFSDSIISADNIMAYIKRKSSDSPMLDEPNIGEAFIDAGITNGVNPAYLVATAWNEGKFGTDGWAKTHSESHNTFGYGIPPGNVPPNEINSASTWSDMIYRVAKSIAKGEHYFSQGLYTVKQVRSEFVGNSNDKSLSNMVDIMNELHKFSADTSIPKSISAQIFPAEKELGGIDFSSISMNFITVGKTNDGEANIDFVLKAKKADGTLPGIDLINSTLLSTISLMIGISLASNKFWVNLNPWEPDRIIDDELAGTDVGRIMLEADLQMKKDFANYGNPCANDTGKALWTLLDERQKALVESCMEKFPGEIEDENNVRFGYVTRYWIIPDNVDVYTNGTEIYIANSTLGILSEPTIKYSFFKIYNQNRSDLSEDCREELNRSAREFNQYARDLQDAMILPFVLEDVNHHEKYEDLRNVYYSLALAEAYKGKIAPEVDVFQAGLDANSGALDAMSSWSPKEVWERYVYSFENGEYMCWQNQTEIVENGILMQSEPYATGGVDFGRISENMTMIKGIPKDIAVKVDEAISKGIAYDKKDVLFGARIHMDLRSNDSISENNSGKDQTSRQSMDEDSSCPPCPDGWDGPDENCICWMPDCPAGWYRPNDTSECEIWKDPMKCPPGYEGPNEKGECLKLEMQCPPGYEGPDENGYCWKKEAKSL